MTWSVDGQAGGSSGLGVISASGLYSAPALVPASGVVTVSATSKANSGASGSASVTVTAAPAPPPAIVVTMAPTNPSVQVSQTLSFTVNVENDAQNEGVTWSLSGCGGGACGTLTNVTATSVTYTAPASVPNPATNVITATSVSDGTKSASTTITVTAGPPPVVPIVVTLAPSSPSVQVSQTQSFSVNVQNDAQNKGVTWAVSGCSGTACGTLTNVTAISATYTAPAAVPSPATNVITATSASDGTKSASTTITVTAQPPPPIVVAVAPTNPSVQVSRTQSFSVSVQNDAKNKGVTWAVSGCSGTACGTLTNVTATSVTYTAPAAVPSPAANVITATSVSDGTKSASTTITVTAAPPPPIIVSVAPTNPSVQVSLTQNFSVTVQNDGQSKGVTWALSGCSGSACGQLTNVAPTSVTYTAPATVPSPATNVITATSVSDGTKSASTTITVTAAPPPPIVVTVAPTNPTVQVSLTQNFSVAVQNDAQNKGVTWALSGCSGTACGTLTSVTPTSVTYTAPASVPSPATNVITATSVSDATKSASTTITVTAAPPPPIVVTVAPTGPSVQVSQTQNFSVTVQNDAQNRGVTWALSGCSGSACGTLTNVTSTSVTYTAPLAVPSPATNVITATSVTDGTKSGSTTITIAVASSIMVTVSPKRAAVTTSQTTQFTATVNGDPGNLGETWAVDGTTGGNSTAGTISPTGLYTPGTQAGSHTVTATSIADTSKSASITIAVTDLQGVFTYHNDPQRTGVNAQEYALTAATVNSSSFGLLFTCTVDSPGFVYAQPLYVANLMMSDSKRHNVLFVATESDWVYAYDADASSCQQLWRTRVLGSGETTVNPVDVDDTDDLLPEIGVTSTPVIDPATNTLYVVSKSEDASRNFYHRLYALDLTTGSNKSGSPALISAANFNVLTHMQRPALLLNGGTLYIAFGSHGDANTYQGWVMGYNASTLAQEFVWSSTDPTSGNNEGAIWMFGNGPAVDSSGNVYLETANGVFDAASGGNNYSDSVIELSSAGAVLDYFTPRNQGMLAADDIDLGSSGPIVLPDALGNTAHPHLLLATGKTGMLYLLDRDNLGKYSSAADTAYQEAAVDPNDSNENAGVFGQPAVFNGQVYISASGDPIELFTISSGSISTTAQSHSSHSFVYRGTTPSVSANGTSNGILWALDTSADLSSGAAVLYAYDASNLGTELYASPTSGSGAGGPAIKSTVPTIANGKVYVGGQGTISVFGLQPN